MGERYLDDTSSSRGRDESTFWAGAVKPGLASTVTSSAEDAVAPVATKRQASATAIVRTPRRYGTRTRLHSPAVIVNRAPNARGPYTAFAEVAGAYERGRPGYPEEAVRWLAGSEPRDVVDLGAGTGKLTRALVELGHRVTAIEPLPEMLELLPAAAPGAGAILGSAEIIPLPDAFADVVTCAQAFHWFDHAVALPEIARVLRPGGRLALVWNTRDDAEPWVARLSAIIGSESVGVEDGYPPIDESGLFGPVETSVFRFDQLLDRETLLELVLSRSYCAKLPPAEREPILEAVGRLYDEEAGPDGLRLPYLSECFRAPRRD